MRILHSHISEAATLHTSLHGNHFIVFHAVCWWCKTLPRQNGPRRQEWWQNWPGRIPLVLSYDSHSPLWFLQELRNCISQPIKLPCYFLCTLLLLSSLHFLFPILSSQHLVISISFSKMDNARSSFLYEIQLRPLQKAEWSILSAMLGWICIIKYCSLVLVNVHSETFFHSNMHLFRVPFLSSIAWACPVCLERWHLHNEAPQYYLLSHL